MGVGFTLGLVPTDDPTRPSTPESPRMTLPPDRGAVATEKRNPRTGNLHALSIEQIAEVINHEDRDAVQALKRAGPRLTRLIGAIEAGFLAGGRLIYVGAGTSGRLGVLDASEAPPTFCVPPGRIVGLIAGGDAALRTSSEGAEDDAGGAWPELDRLALTPHDAVIAIAAGGTTPYALGAVGYCRQDGKWAGRGPLTALLTCSEPPEGFEADHVVILKTGPEVIAGSTRMKAGTATKLALNTISTTLMVRSGRVYQNLMVDVRVTNDKLRDRAARIVGTLTGQSREACFEALKRAGGSTKLAVLMHRSGLSRDAGEAALERAGGRLHVALGEDA